MMNQSLNWKKNMFHCSALMWMTCWFIWCGIHTSIIFSSGLLHYGMHHRISWHVTAYFSLMQHYHHSIPSPPETSHWSQCCFVWPSHSGHPGDSGPLKWWDVRSHPTLEWIYIGDCGTSWSGHCLQLWGFNAPKTWQHLQPLGSTFICLGGKV